MLSLLSSVSVLLLAVQSLAAPTDLIARDTRTDLISKRDVAPGTGTNHGYYYSYYNSGSDSSVKFHLGDGGKYHVEWTDCDDFVAGKGWATGQARVIKYSGHFETSGNAYLSVYGWSTDPLVEYYIMDSYGDYNPGSAATYKGSVKSDGGTYDIYEDTRTDAPSIEGTATFSQYLSIRTTKRVGGTITTANHFNAWAKLGMKLGTLNYQILATEGYESSGSATITVF